jgi:hypothetical protein
METASAKILKAAAPLCSDNWRIYVERSQDGDRCRFGVFCGSSDPAALTVDEIVLDGLEVGFPIIRIAQSVTNKVELQTNIGDGIEFRFNDDADVPDLDNKRRILDLANIVASALAPQGSSFSGYVARLLTTAIRESHGTLIAVVSDDTNVLPVALQDAISLDPPLDLYERHRLHHEEGATAASVSRLQVASELVSGFVRSDGITVLNTCGKVLGYRAFIHMDSPTQPSAGGARSRAFAAMVGLLGTQLKAAFFRSEDGRMEMRIAAESAENG